MIEGTGRCTDFRWHWGIVRVSDNRITGTIQVTVVQAFGAFAKDIFHFRYIVFEVIQVHLHTLRLVDGVAALRVRLVLKIK